MDIISHGLIGCAIGQFYCKTNVKKVGIAGMTAMLPDFFQIPYYLTLGYLCDRPFYIPYNEDWTGFRGQLPLLDLVWDVPHSLLFLVLVVVPIVKKFRLEKILILSYLSHIIADIPTHTGEWNLRYFFPLEFTINGVTDAWKWNLTYLAISWIILVVINFYIYKKNRDEIYKNTESRFLNKWKASVAKDGTRK